MPKTTSLETARKLKAEGFDQECDWYYHMSYGGSAEQSRLELGVGAEPFNKLDEFNIAAPTAQELLDAIKASFPMIYWSGEDEGWVVLIRSFQISKRLLIEDFDEKHFKNQLLVEALAEGWLYLKRNELV